MSHQVQKAVKTLQDAVQAFQDHEGVSVTSVAAWSNQFGAAQQNLALKILGNINYYSGARIRLMVEKLVDLVRRRCQLNEVKNILFVPIGGPSEGSSVVARALRGVAGVRREQIKNLTDLASVPGRSSIRAIVLLDDFSGSGQRLVDWWRNMETLLLPWAEKPVKLILVLLVLNHKAEKALRGIPLKTLYVDYLDPTYDILSEESKIFFRNEKAHIEQFCRRTGCAKKFMRGYQDCGLLVAFKHGCPNNSLPILWYESHRWKRLFRRRAI